VPALLTVLLTVTVPLCTLNVPLLFRDTGKESLPMESFPVLWRVPKLLKVPSPPMLPVPCSVQEAPVWLLTVAPLLRSNGPATVAAPKLFSVRLKRLGDAVNGDAALAGTDRPPLRLVTPGRPMVGLPPMVPPDHVVAPVTVIVAGPVNPPAMN